MGNVPHNYPMLMVKHWSHWLLSAAMALFGGLLLWLSLSQVYPMLVQGCGVLILFLAILVSHYADRDAYDKQLFLDADKFAVIMPEVMTFIWWSEVKQIYITQTRLGKLFNYGDIKIVGHSCAIGDFKLIFRHMRRPRMVRVEWYRHGRREG